MSRFIRIYHVLIQYMCVGAFGGSSVKMPPFPNHGGIY